MDPSAIPLGRLADMAYIALDTETTGTDPTTDEIVEIAAIKFREGRIVDKFESLIDPMMPIPPEASAIHQLSAEDVEDAPTLGYIEPLLIDFCGSLPIVAHNADFDRGFLPMLHRNVWIDTHRAARHLWPNAKSHALQYLRYWLGLECIEARGAAPHRATADAIVAGRLFHHEVGRYEYQHPLDGVLDLVDWIQSPIHVANFNYGKKWRGAPISTIGSGFFNWLLSDDQIAADFRGKIDADTMAAVNREILARAGAKAAA